ncbi:MAG: hypothetical protein DRI61_15605 [Chloroflexi bacterium]|nr:MAG: hypothetical protein DRI61_15605 [Chloroflexota bacterium]
MTCLIDGHEIEIITIEDILQKISKSTANLTDEQKIIMKLNLLQYEYEKLTDVINCLPKMQKELYKLRDGISRELKIAEADVKKITVMK